LTSILNIIEYPPALELGSKLVVIYPSSEDFDLSIQLMLQLRKIGKPVGIVDIILAAIAINRDLIVVSNDRDFVTLKQVAHNLKTENFKS
jgi:PIN domain.